MTAPTFGAGAFTRRRLALAVALASASGSLLAEPFISEIHYDNAGGDVGEAVEVQADAGTVLDGYQLLFYNGNGGTVYRTETLAGTVADQAAGQGVVVVDLPANGIQNGAPDGIALVTPAGALVEFLSYEGTFTGVGDAADGVESTDIGVAESSATAVGDSLQLLDGTWQAEAPNSFGAVNGATGEPPVEPPPEEPGIANPAGANISEFHYDNDGADVGEAIEIEANAGASLDGYTVVRYNGSNGASYGTDSLSGTVEDLGGGRGVFVLNLPANGLQNGAPDGIALVDPLGNVVEFLSYEGVFTATDGPAVGVTSTDVGVSEPGSTPVGHSLQLIGGTWQEPAPNSFNALNGADNGGGNGGGEEPVVELVRISAIQGATDASPLVGQQVAIEAVVVGDFQDGDADTGRSLRGFFLQEEDTDVDALADTSEGLFVFDGATPLADVALGDLVRVVGTVEEYFGETQLSNVTAVTVLSSGNALPTAAEITLPAAATTLNQNGRVQPDLEAFEGMRVVFPQTLTINEQFQLDRFNEVKLVQGDRPVQFTQNNAPDALGYQASLEEIGARQITYDDGLNFQNVLIGNLDGFGPVYSTANAPRMGDQTTGLSGVLDYKWAGNGASGSTWRVRSAVDGSNVIVSVNERSAAPAAVAGRLRVASLNVLNYFATLDLPGATVVTGLDPRGADNAEEFARQTQKLVTSIVAMDVDVLGLVELENDFLEGSAGNAIEALVGALNERVGAGTWDWVRPGVQSLGTDAIGVGFIYRPAVVTTVGTPAILDSAAFVDPNNSGLGRNRPALAVSFEEVETGERFTAVTNHLKSKGPSGLDSDPTPSPADVDMLDGQGYWNDTRAKAAAELVTWLGTAPTGIEDPDLLILGDLNAYASEDPVTVLEANGFTDLAVEAFGEAAYSYVFDGQVGTLDYALANEALLSQVVDVAEWHVNADEADAIDYNTDFGKDPAIFDGAVPYRHSDHDPVIIGMDLDSEAPVLTVALSKSVLFPPTHRMVQVTAVVSAIDNVDGEVAFELVSVTSDEADDGVGDGNTTGDVVVLDDTTFQLRAERSTVGDGRTYSVTYRATDSAGNVSEKVATVDVPLSRNQRALDLIERFRGRLGFGLGQQ